MSHSVVFMGTPDFAVSSLDALVEAGYDVRAVVTNPDRRSGRGRKLQPPAVKVAAEKHGLTILQPPKLKNLAVLEQIQAFEPDFFVVAAYGSILGPRYLATPRIAPVNVHASLLPRYRGSAPIHWSIVRGEQETGVCIMRMERGMDTGGVYHEGAIPILDTDTTGSLHDRLAELGARLLIEALPGIADGSREAAPQDPDKVTFAPMLTKADGAVSFDEPASAVDRRIRGMLPWPGAFCRFRGDYVKLHGSAVAGGRGEPGTVIALSDDAIVVACGEGAVALPELQKQGKSRVSARDFIHGYKVQVGDRFEADPLLEERRS